MKRNIKDRITNYNTVCLISMLIICCYFLNGCDVNPSANTSKIASNEKNVYLKGEMPLQHGMELFNQHCGSCHNFSENLIGPNLMGITSTVDKEWLTNFISDAPRMIESGDARSVELFEKYKQYMPPFPMIGPEDMEDILAFIHKFSQGEKRNKNNRKGGLINPIPEKIATSNLILELEEQFKAPSDPQMTPITRINQMSAAPGGRLFIHDLRGKLYEISKTNTLTPYIDLSEKLPQFVDNPGKGSGFGSWVFHPDFERNGLLYTTHTESPGSIKADFTLPDSIDFKIQSVLLEWKATNPNDAIFSGTYRELIRVDMVSTGHTFQEVTFNPLAEPNTADYGMLYLGIGDGSAALRGYGFLCDDINYIYSSVIRINPLGNNSANGKYGIPNDNPFVNIPQAVEEIWAYGFRNPHRITWDETGTGKMLITNIGQHSVEEINLGKAGANYGWPHREGTFLFDVDANVELVYPLPTEDDKYTNPVVQYDHDEGSAISGGFVYSGLDIPVLRGKYIFGDMSRGWLYYSEVEEMVDGQQAPLYRLNVSMNNKVSDMESITQTKRVDLRIGRDGDGEIYLFTKGNGAVYKVVGCQENDML